MKNKISLSQKFRSWLWKRKRESAENFVAYNLCYMDGTPQEICLETIRIMKECYKMDARNYGMPESTYNVLIDPENYFDHSGELFYGQKRIAFGKIELNGWWRDRYVWAVYPKE